MEEDRENKRYAFSGCFVATVVYGDSNAHEVKVLRDYRDTVLSKSMLGRIFIKIYYRHGRMLAYLVKNSPAFLVPLTRFFLDYITLKHESSGFHYKSSSEEDHTHQDTRTVNSPIKHESD